MKSELPYFGVRMPDFRRTVRKVLRERPLGSRAELEAAVAELWDQAEFREERYAATALTAAYPQWVDLPMLERLIVMERGGTTSTSSRSRCGGCSPT